MTATAPVLRLELDSVGALIKAYAAFIAEGHLAFPVKATQAPPPGAEVGIVLDTRGVGVFEGSGRVVATAGEPGRTYASLVMARRLRNFIQERAIERRQGRLTGAAEGRRKHARYDTYLPVRAVRGENFGAAHAINIGRGGLFIATEKPPALATRLRVQLTFPRGQVEVDLSVNRVLFGGEEAPGFGAVFVNEDVTFADALERLLADYSARAPRLLLVDDDKFFRTALGTELEAAGLKVDEAVDGEDGLKRLREHLLELDLLVLDLMMPKLGGPELLVRLRGLSGAMELPVVILSGARTEYLQAFLAEGMAADVIEKNQAIPVLVERIRKVLKKSERG